MLSECIDQLSGSLSHAWYFNDCMGFNDGEMLCIYRWKIWWAIPKLMSGLSNEDAEGSVPSETYFIVGRMTDGDYMALIPSIDKNVGFSFEGSQSIDSSSSDKRLVLNGHQSSKQFHVGDGHNKAVSPN